MTSVIRRTVAALVALGLLIIGVQLIGTSSASAHANELSGVPECQTSTGTYTVVWTVINDYNGPDTVTIVTSAPGGTFAPPTTLHLPPNGSGTLTQSGIPGTATSASLKLHGNWTDPKDPWQGDTALVTVPLSGPCVAPPPNHPTQQVTWTPGGCDHNVVTQPSYTIPNDSDVTYTVTTGGTSTVKPGGTYPVPGGGSFVIDASSTTVTLTGTTHWDFTLTVNSNGCATTATPALPIVTDTRCVNHAPVAPTLAYPNTTGVTYSPPAGTFEAGKTITVTATAATGYTFDDTAANWPTEWTEVDATHATTPVSFAPPVNCGQSVTPATPSVTQTSCSAGRTTPVAPTLTLPNDSAALVYTAKVISPGPSGPAHTYQPGQTVLVTATAQGTYFFDTVASGWTKVSDTVATLTIHFNALGPNECTLSEKATNASFTAEQCVSGTPKGGTYTIPSTTGVVYTVNGTTTKAGTYPATPKSTVHVGAAATTGYKLVGQTTWTHTFGATPQCSSTAPVQVHKPSDVDSAKTSGNNLASTGVPTQNLLTIGFGLLIIGSLSMLLATRRRDSE